MSFRSVLHLYLFSFLPLLAAKEAYQWEDYKTTNEEETLFLRRIADFWQEGEYGIAKNQMEEFLQTFPSSTFADPLSAAIGDLFLREKNYMSALHHYAKITSEDFLKKTFLNRMQCLYHLEWYATLADDCEAHLQESLNPDLALKTTYYLAISLYHQCLNAQNDPELAQKLARRAEPYFETLLTSELSDETAQAFAHLCCILKDFPKAADIYLDLAKKEPEIEEEMSFQAALIQAEFDKSAALETFKELAQMRGKRAQEATYNQMVLLFEANEHEELLQTKEALLNNVPSNKKGMAYLFLGRSCLALQKYEQAASELKNFIKETPDNELEALQTAFLSLIEASFQSNDLNGMNLALTKLAEIKPSHPEIAKGRFSRALLLKKLSNTDGARAELENLLIDFPQISLRAQLIFELAHLEYQTKNWASCRSYAKDFVTEFPHSELTPFAWRYLASASSSLATENPENREFKEILAFDLESLLKQEKMFSPVERNDWQFFLSKVNFDLGCFEEAISSLNLLLKESSFFPQQPNAYLLLAICYRDGLGDLDEFCSLAETAIDKKADLMEKGSLHTALFNAYLTRAKQNPDFLEKAAEHLYCAFEQTAALSGENLIWLAAYYEERFAKDKMATDLAEKSSVIYYHLLSNSFIYENVEKESILYKLAKLYAITGKPEQQIALLNQLIENYPASEYQVEAQFLLAEGYSVIGNKTLAASLYDLVAKTAPPIRSKVSAKAHLQGARLHSKNVLEQKLPIDHPETILALTQLKDLILQKTLANEPIHWEAALEYAYLKEKIEPQSFEKKISLLKKLKADFESEEDLLSQDYHRAREKFPEKEKIYLGYIRLLDAEILLEDAKGSPHLSEQKELQAKGKDLLLEIIKEKAHPALVSRAASRLQATDVGLTEN